MTIYCLHEDCLELLKTFDNNLDLQRHTMKNHIITIGNISDYVTPGRNIDELSQYLYDVLQIIKLIVKARPNKDIPSWDYFKDGPFGSNTWVKLEQLKLNYKEKSRILFSMLGGTFYTHLGNLNLGSDVSYNRKEADIFEDNIKNIGSKEYFEEKEHLSTGCKYKIKYYY